MGKNYKNRKLLLIGIIIVLVLINLTALGTIGYHKYKNRHNSKREWRPDKRTKQKREDRIKDYVKKELNLTDKQSPVYFKSMDENFNQMNLMLGKISDCKKRIMEQTLKNNPDTLKINQLCDSLGHYHNQMQRGMSKHFRGVIEILDTVQKAKLKQILMRMQEKSWGNDDRENHKN